MKLYQNLNVTGSIILSGSMTTVGVSNNIITGSLLISGSATALQINNNTLFVSSSGNIGIGTTNPVARFDLSGSIGNFQIASSGAEVFLTRNDNNDILATGGSNSGLSIGAQSYVRFSTGTGYTERVRINSSGSVTIGTTSLTGWGASDRILKIQGSSGVSVVQAVSSDAGCAVWLYSGASSADNPSIIYAKNLRFGSATDLGTGGYNERMRITSAGSVIIGTTDAFNGEKLRVAGTISSGVSAMTVTGAVSTSVPSGTATTVWTCPDFPRVMYYMVFVRIDSGANADTYSAYAVISASNIAGAKLLTNVGSSGMTISISGRDVRVTQTSGATQNVHTSVIQIFSSSGTT